MKIASVFVHTSDRHLLPALLSIYSLRARRGTADTYKVRLLRLEGSALDDRRDGSAYCGRGLRIWNHLDFTSFQLLRRRVPAEMQYQGRALVIDPDIFAVASVQPLLDSDMNGKAIRCRYMKDGFLGDGRPYYSSGVMLLDCERLAHWRWDEEVDRLFSGNLDYWDLLQLVHEDPDTIGELGEQWNSLDILNSGTRLLHYTRVSTQPWLTGLPLPDGVYDPTVKTSVMAKVANLLGRPIRPVCRPHPDSSQEQFFFGLLAEAIHVGAIPTWFVESQIGLGRVRKDILDKLAPLSAAQCKPAAGSRPSLLEEYEIDAYWRRSA